MEGEEIYVYRIARNELRAKAIELHHRRYEEVGFLKKGEKDEYESDSLYFIVQNRKTNEVVGTTRLIFKEIEKLPTFKHFFIYDLEKRKLSRLELGRYAEISAFTKLPQHDVGLGLVRTVLQYSLRKGLTHWICCIDERVYNYMHRIFRFPFKVIGEPKVYLGSRTIPCSLHLEECLHHLKNKRMTLYHYFMTSKPEAFEVIES